MKPPRRVSPNPAVDELLERTPIDEFRSHLLLPSSTWLFCQKSQVPPTPVVYQQSEIALLSEVVTPTSFAPGRLSGFLWERDSALLDRWQRKAISPWGVMRSSRFSL
jgi:hypothetical protein